MDTENNTLYIINNNSLCKLTADITSGVKDYQCIGQNKRYNFPGVFSLYNVSRGGSFKVYIKRVIYNNPATIVFWSDNTKTVTKCSPKDTYNCETGLAICILKKLFGSTKIKEILTAWVPENIDEISDSYGFEVSLATLRKREKNSKKSSKIS